MLSSGDINAFKHTQLRGVLGNSKARVSTKPNIGDRKITAKTCCMSLCELWQDILRAEGE